MTSNDPLRELLTFDPLDAAEKITGGSIHDDVSLGGLTPTMSLGFLLMRSHSDAKRDVLMDRGDTTHGDTLDRYLSIIETAGFEQALRIVMV